MAYVVKIEGLAKLEKLFKQLPVVVQKEIKNEMSAIGDEWVGAARRDAPADRGRTRGSISKKSAATTLEIIAQAQQAAYMEFGTKKYFKAPAALGNYPAQFRGSNTTGVNPITALTEWVKRKGLNAPTYSVKTKKKSYKNKSVAARAIAFMIFRKIKKWGVKPQPFLFTGANGEDRLGYFTDKIKKSVSDVLKRAVNG